MPELAIRPGVEADLDRLLVLNNAAVPAVNELDRGDLQRFLKIAPHFQVAVIWDRPVGLMIALAPGLDYGSLNYRWFEERYDGFLYIDRVVVDPDVRSAGIGAALYRNLELVARERGISRLACEVNLRPSNDRSLRFHERLGFRGVGTQDTENGAKTVQLMVWELNR
jgi:predicted GNAT superfamily acetyltransferase